MKATCFICGVDSHSFEKKPGVSLLRLLQLLTTKFSMRVRDNP